MAENGQLFNSKTDPIPFIRPELDIIPIENEGKSYLYFHDIMGYATPNFALNSQIGTVLSLLDGSKSIKDLEPYLGDGVTTDQLLEYIQFLDGHRLLYSSHMKQHAEKIEQRYEATSVHHAKTAGYSYPADPDELNSFLDEAFSKQKLNGSSDQTNVKALYAPHIDPRVGLESYVKAFSAIKHLAPKRVVILATSHYADIFPNVYNNFPFIVSGKDFEMPLSTVKADRQSIEKLFQYPGNAGINRQDRAHRIEHSIELHLLFISYLWDHDFEIIPILVKDFDELYYMEKGHLSAQVEVFGKLLNKTFGKDRDTLFLISGDLAHVGRKFGDEEPAGTMLDEVKNFDSKFLNFAKESKTQSMFNLMKQNYDPYRICGFAPLYTFLKAFPDTRGEILSYDIWDEKERESAVTYGSILYHA